ncbi:MAG: hypothetical protein QOI73_866 [Solirubrobacteraceae bacterium]|nr:hypothetical protein [Solirubrobacteraceae bacterium]
MTWSLEIATDQIRQARDVYRENARLTRIDCEAAQEPQPEWWPKDDAHTLAALTRRLERFEHASALATACLGDLQAISALVAEDSRERVAT